MLQGRHPELWKSQTQCHSLNYSGESKNIKNNDEIFHIAKNRVIQEYKGESRVIICLV